MKSRYTYFTSGVILLIISAWVIVIISTNDKYFYNVILTSIAVAMIFIGLLAILIGIGYKNDNNTKPTRNR